MQRSCDIFYRTIVASIHVFNGLIYTPKDASPIFFFVFCVLLFSVFVRPSLLVICIFPGIPELIINKKRASRTPTPIRGIMFSNFIIDSYLMNRAFFFSCVFLCIIIFFLFFRPLFLFSYPPAAITCFFFPKEGFFMIYI